MTELPKFAASFEKLGIEHGWMSRIVHAVSPLTDLPNVSVRLKSPDGTRRVFALWIDGKFNNAITSNPFQMVTLTQAKDYVKHE